MALSNSQTHAMLSKLVTVNLSILKKLLKGVIDRYSAMAIQFDFYLKQTESSSGQTWWIAVWMEVNCSPFLDRMKAEGWSLGWWMGSGVSGDPGTRGSRIVCRRRAVMDWTTLAVQALKAWTSSSERFSAGRPKTPRSDIQISSNCCLEVQPRAWILLM